MKPTTLDWAIVLISIAISFTPTILLARRAGRSTTEFFTSGRAAPWWLVGASMVATTFSTDTPNLVTNFVRTGGVANNWAWWAFLLTGMATVFFYARLWRRSRVLTDLEFYEIRYSGRPATFVRGFRALYLGLFFNCIIMATVNLAAVKIANVVLGWSMLKTLAICTVLNIAFAATSGLWGVMVTDTLQFVIAMTASFAAAYFAVKQPAVGGLTGLLHKIPAKTLNVLPDFGDWKLTVSLLIVPLTVQWWSVWYPGAEPGGGSYIAQRMLAAKSERDALSGTLFFNVMHYALRPWPWIVVALSSIIIYPNLSDIASTFPYVDRQLIGHDIAYSAMLKFLPAGFLGLMIAGMRSAYESTLSTHLNWGTSYIVHDFYRRFIRPGEEERHYVLAGRVVTGLLMLAAAGVTFVLTTAQQSFNLMMSIGAGTGLIYLLRWFWWRINAWSEIAAMASSFVVSVGFFIAQKLGADIDATTVLLVTIAVTTICWVTATYLTEATDVATLTRFYALVRPPGPGWRGVRERSGLPESSDSLAHSLLGWVLGCTFVYAGLFGAGSLLYERWAQGAVWVVLFVVSGIGLVRLLKRVWSDERSDVSASTSVTSPPTKALILARGLGTRMRAPDNEAQLSREQAAAADSGVKAMIAIDRPFLDYVLSALADAGFTETCLVVGPEHGALRKYYDQNPPSRVRVQFAIQDKPLGTADAVLAAADFIGGDAFVVLNSDNYYPPEVLRLLRDQTEAALPAFERETLVRGGNIPADRIARYALLDIDADSYLCRIVEKPDAETERMFGPDPAVSMNVWLLTPAILEACRRVAPSARGELELPNAVQWAIDHLGMRIRAVPVRAAVLDLSHRGDIPEVAARLRGVPVRL
ncbi:MAG TPA: sugar phosphate nucleotidyltransferase [Gemmatimonadaceae bacterium]|nr:sugar phosphate nucleotidyltransferase [Gemmatimonadaceae bacterium]